MSNNIVKHEQLHDIAGDLWDKAKKRDITALEYEANTKTLKGKNSVDTVLLNARLTDLVSINDRAEFKKDVSVDDAKTVSNSNIGSINGPVPAGNRTTGYRGLTSKQFTDGYVKLLRVYLPANTVDTIGAHVWMIKKGASKAEDKLLAPKIFKSATVITSGTNKYIDVEIERKFTDETFFVLRTEGNQQIQGINNIKQEFRDDIINVNDQFNPSSTTDNINWNNFAPNTDLVGHMELHGRTGIVDISKRLEEINLASGNYVLQSDTTATGGTGQEGKVVKLGADGKLHTNMLPELAINRVLTANNKSAALSMRGPNKEQLQLGDVVIITAEQNKVYMCKNDATDATFDDAFIELSLGNGTVKTVADGSPNAQGNIQVTVAEEGTEGIKVTFGSSGGTAVKIATYMTEQEVRAIKDLFV